MYGVDTFLARDAALHSSLSLVNVNKESYVCLSLQLIHYYRFLE